MVKIWFDGFWEGFSKSTNIFVSLIQKYCLAVITPDNPDIVFLSSFKKTDEWKNATKVFFNGERSLDIECQFDFSFGPEVTNGTHQNFPCWLLFTNVFGNLTNGEPNFLVDPFHITPTNFQRDFFCCQIIRNGNCKKRNTLFNSVTREIGFVHSLGSYKKNSTLLQPSNSWVKSKLNVLGKFKFSLCCENFSEHGYLTEKLLHGLVAGTIPVYWGDPFASQTFNPKRFISIHDYKPEEYHRLIHSINESDDRRGEILSHPLFTENQQIQLFKLTQAVEYTIQRVLNHK